MVLPLPTTTAVILTIVVSGLPGASVRTPDPPDSAVNPQSGYIETTDSAWDRSRYIVRHVTDPGAGGDRRVASLSSSEADDLSPRLATSAAGDTWVVWWRDGEICQVLARKRSHDSGRWAGETPLSDKAESSRYPEIVHDGSRAWVVFEFDASGGETGVGVNSVIDEPNPIPVRQKLAQTDFAGDLDTSIHFDSGNLWVTWVDSASDVGWCAYDHSSETWEAPGYESYATDTVEEARARIRAARLDE
jgi:hypothetical protein